jgi:hypothetical protein
MMQLSPKVMPKEVVTEPEGLRVTCASNPFHSLVLLTYYRGLRWDEF